MTKSLEQRLYEAYRNCTGLRLSADDVDLLVHDEAIASRIRNAAAASVGGDESGGDDVLPNAERLPWAKFCELFREEPDHE